MLRRLRPYDALDWQSLNTLARHARLIDLPAGRRLPAVVSEPRCAWYLLRGRLRCNVTSRVVRPTSHALELEGSAFVTASRARLLHVDTAPVAFLLDDTGLLHSAGPAAAAHELAACSWQQAFLSSYLLRELPASHWQQILRSLAPEEHGAGAVVLKAGAPGDCCYILARGRAEVRRSGRVVRRLAPGDFFGEDALLLDGARTATVRMREAGTVMRLEAASFERWLAGALVVDTAGAADPFSNQHWQPLTVASAERLRERVAELDPCCAYAVSGAPGPSRLAVFLLRGRGVRAALV